MNSKPIRGLNTVRPLASTIWTGLTWCVMTAATFAQPLPAVDGREHLGVKSCSSSSCHGSIVERNAYNVLQNEYQTWTRHDRHSRAYETLLGERSRRIAKNLNLDNAHEARVCLDCHADNVAPARRGRFFNLSDGVGCEACHGGAEEWLGSHISGRASQAGNRQLGLYPTADAGARAGLCLSCHLGTREKFAGHDIMGAGHPRLSFELYTFTRRQPAHYRVDADYRQRKGATAAAVEWAAGVLVAAETNLRLLEHHYDTNGMFPELAFFDCHGCHHSMERLRWQPEPGYGQDSPGVVRLEDSRLKMAALLASWAEAPAIDPQLAALHRASRQGRGELLAAAGTLRGAIDGARARVLGAARASGASASLRARLTSTAAAGGFNDYADIEQAAMALQALGGGDLDAIFDSLLDADTYEPQTTAAEFARLAGPGAPAVAQPPPVPERTSGADSAASSPVGSAPAGEVASVGIVNVAALRVRAGPSLSAPVIASLLRDARVSVLETEGFWSRIGYGSGETGWVASRYLTSE